MPFVAQDSTTGTPIYLYADEPHWYATTTCVHCGRAAGYWVSKPAHTMRLPLLPEEAPPIKPGECIYVELVVKEQSNGTT